MHLLGDRYEVIESLGSGGLADVFRVRDHHCSDRIVALKRPRDASLNHQLHREFLSLSRVQHPNLPAVYDFHSDLGSGMPGYTLEVAMGQSADVVADRVGFHAVYDIAVGLLRAIAHIHAQGLVHGDIHPYNVMVATDIDDGVEQVTSVKLLDLTSDPSENAIGALPFMAPERLEGQAGSPACDLFSIGVTLHRLLTGGLPYPNYPAEFAGIEPTQVDKLGNWRSLVTSLLSALPKDRPLRALDALGRLTDIHPEPVQPITLNSVRVSLEHGSTIVVEDWPERLANATHECLDNGQHGLMFVTGPAGSGRSRALREVKWAIQPRRDVAVLTVETSGHPLPFAAIRTLIDAMPPGLLDELPHELSISRSALRDGSIVHSVPTSDANRGLEYICDQLAQLIMWPTRKYSIAVLVDDWDRLDPWSKGVLATVSRTLLHQPAQVGTMILMLTTTEIDKDTLEFFQDTPLLHIFPIPEFTAIETLLKRTFVGLSPTHRLLQELSENASGNPLIVCTMIQKAFECGWLTLTDNDVGLDQSAPTPLPIPTSGFDSLLLGLENREFLAKQIMSLVAALPTPIEMSALTHAVDIDERRALQTVQTLCDQRLLQWEVWEGTGHLRVASAGLATAVVDLIPVPQALLERLSKSDDPSTSLLTRVACCFAAAMTANLDEERFAPITEELIAHGLAEPLLSVVNAVGESTLRHPRTLRAVGHAHALLGNEQEAQQAYDRLESDEANLLRAVLLCRHGHHKQAIERFGDLETSHPDTLRWLGIAHLKLGHYPRASAICVQARKLADTDLTHARIDYLQGLVEFYQGEYESAYQRFDDALSVFQTENQLSESAETINAQGLIHYRRSEMERGMKCFNEALSIATRSGDRNRIMTTLMNIAVIHQERGEYDRAASRYREAHTMADVLGNQSGRMQSGMNLGNLNRFLGQLDEALTNLTESLSIAQEHGNRYVEALTLSLLGEVAWLRGAPGEGRALLEEAVETFEDMNSQGELADCLRSLARIALEEGDIESSTALANQSLSIASKSGLQDMRVRAMLVLSEAERTRKKPALDKALNYALNAKELLRSGGRPELNWEVHFALSRAYRTLGNETDATANGQQAVQALEGIANTLPHALRQDFLSLKDRAAILNTLSDVPTPMIETEESVEHSRQLSRLLDINRRLTSELDIDRLLEYIIDSAILLTQSERGFLLLAAKEDELSEPSDVDVVVARNIDGENIRKKKDKVSYSIAKNVIDEGIPVLTTDAMADERYNQYRSIHHMKLRSVMCLPMIAKGDVIGALYLDNRFQEGAFTTDDLKYMEAFANQASIAITNARILSERELALTKLDESRQQVEDLNKRLEEQLAEKAMALETSERVIEAQQKQLSGSHRHENIIGESAALQLVIHALDRVASSDVSVLVTGESGTGKELIARAIHYHGGRKNRPFVAINCSSIPENLIESELFGHVRGAFTGATRDRQGMFEVADKGTLFLDEIGDMPLEMQAKLLRTLQDGQIQKVGSSQTHQVDVRIVAATHRKLREMIKQGTFREDLYYRLAVVTLETPALRNRREDIPLLVHHFIQLNQDEHLGHVTDISPGALRLLMRYDWPGNVRELSMAIKNASVFAETDTLQPNDFNNFPGIADQDERPVAAPTTKMVRALAELEREAIVHALEANQGNKKQSAADLGIDRRTLYNKLATYGISVQRKAQLRSGTDPEPNE